MAKIALKTFWERVEQRLAAASGDELRAILRAMAQSTPPADRQAFLDRLKPPAETADRDRKVSEQEDLLAEIDDLVGDIESATEQADEWEERYDYPWDGDDDEDNLGAYEEFLEPLADLFDRAEAAFDYGDLPLARAAYEKLFEEALQVEDDYGRGPGPEDLAEVDLGEACARYLRAVYETEPPAQRPQALFEHMRRTRSWFVGPPPMLDDLIQLSARPLPEQDRFLQDWLAFLRKQSGAEADAWLREAVRLSQGTAGLEALARAEGKKRPRAYLDWLTALEGEGKYREGLAAAQEALQTLPARLPIRAAVADHLCTAAARLKDQDALRAGRWEALAAQPTLLRLLDLWDAALSAEDRTALMRQAASHVKNYLAHPPRRPEVVEAWWDPKEYEMPVWIEKSVLAHAYLLAEDRDAARQLAAREKVLGWSSSDNPQGLVLPFFLVLLSGKAPGALPPNLASLWKQALTNSLGFGQWADEARGEAGVLKRLERIYVEQFRHAATDEAWQADVLAWCLEVAGQRVIAIVSNQHRRSYDKAAVLIAACAEVLRQRDQDQEARELLDSIRNRFPRHRAFQAELDKATQPTKRSKR